MGATLAAVGSFFSSAAPAAAATEVAGSSALAIASGAAETAAVAELSLGSAAALDAAAAAQAVGAGGGLLSTFGKGLAQGAAGGVVSSLLTPKPPKAGQPLAMPDPLAQEQARRQSLIEQTARRGRAASIMTDASGGKLGD